MVDEQAQSSAGSHVEWEELDKTARHTGLDVGNAKTLARREEECEEECCLRVAIRMQICAFALPGKEKNKIYKM